MTSGAASGAVSGAASGAAAGAVLGPWGAAIGGIVGGVVGLFSGKSADDQQESQAAWAQYNSVVQYNTSIANAQSLYDLSTYNAVLSKQLTEANVASGLSKSRYNAALVRATTQYNSDLLGIQLGAIWEDLDLDLVHLENYRQREKGAIVADQGASGTLIGEGSNFEAVSSQTAQRALDANALMFGAERQAANVENAKAKNNWEGSVATQNLLYEGQQAAQSARLSNFYQTQGSLATAAVTANAQTRSAQNALAAGGTSIQLNSEYQSLQNTQDLTAGLFQAAGSGIRSLQINSQYDPSVSNFVKTGNFLKAPETPPTVAVGS